MTQKRLVIILIFLIGIVVMVAWIAVAGPVTVLRIVRFGDTNIDDFSHYPGRELHPSDSSFAFNRPENEIAIPTEALVTYAGPGDLDTILESNDSIAFLLIRDDAILYERYFQGHTPSSLSQIFSMTKSFTSALIGTAIQDGYMDSVDQPITDFIPELAQDGFSEVTIHHLLTMTSGSDYQENDNPFGEHVILNYTPELKDMILSFKMEAEPGDIFRYKSGDNAILGLALDRALHPETITEYAQRRIWNPTGMQDRGVWTVDHQGGGLEKTWCCLAASARDIAKFGRLYLNGGVRDAQEVLPASWVEQSTQRGHISEMAYPQDLRSIGWWNYGYQWWLASQQRSDFFALGKDGQFLYVDPSQNTLIVRLGWSTGGLLSSEWITLFQTLSAQTP